MTLRFRRSPASQPVTFSGDCVFGKGIVTNISDRGFKVKGQQTRYVPQGACLTLRLALPRPQGPLKVDQAVVRWSKGQEFGLELLQMQPTEQERLRRFITAL